MCVPFTTCPKIAALPGQRILMPELSSPQRCFFRYMRSFQWTVLPANLRPHDESFRALCGTLRDLYFKSAERHRFLPGLFSDRTMKTDLSSLWTRYKRCCFVVLSTFSGEKRQKRSRVPHPGFCTEDPLDGIPLV